MIKLAILGTENSHSWYFSSVLAPKDGNKKYPDIELLGVYGDCNAEGAEEGFEKIREMSACNVFANHYNDFLDEADAVMITAADGANHFKYAKSYIEKGIPVWIDKPTTRDTSELVEMWELAEKSGAILCGGSALQYADTIKKLADEVSNSNEQICGGHVTAPLSMENSCGGFWYYTQHLVQMMTTVFGSDVKSVRAEKNERGVNAIYRYNGFDVTTFYGSGYSVTVYMNEWVAKAESFDLTATYFMPPLESFIKVLKSGKADKTKKEFMAPVFIIDATIKSYNENREVIIDIQ
ncbi:MAG: Gfo/Idh/MocA family oxidoreductase [Clostridia bacterium]|nr:Gfo/Idh/MocA family oxidoreductase [Clostridia bacterium]